MDVKEIREYMAQMIFKIENPIWQRIVRALYTKYDKEFYSYPAAKTNHHAFETGLAYHTATMVLQHGSHAIEVTILNHKVPERFKLLPASHIKEVSQLLLYIIVISLRCRRPEILVCRCIRAMFDGAVRMR